MNNWQIGKWFSELSEGQLKQLWEYRGQILRFSSAVNLVSAKTLPLLDVVHLADCIRGGLIIINASNHKRIFDIGSGNGLPGLVLAILDSSRHLILVDSDERKCEFLKHVVGHLGLMNVEVLLEAVQKLPAESISCAVSRGFADIPRSLLTVNRIFAKGGAYYHFKGEEWASEVANMPTQLFSTWEPHLVDNYTIPEDKRKLSIVETRKVRA